MTGGQSGQGIRPGLGEIGNSLRDALLRRAGRLSARYQEQAGLAVDLLESEDAYLAVFDAPGAGQTDVQVRYVGGSVLVRIDRFRDYYEGYEMRFPGRGLSLDGEVELPEDALVDAAAASATLTGNGTLEVEIPKREDRPGEDTGEDAADEDPEEDAAEDGTGEDGDDGAADGGESEGAADDEDGGE